MNRNLGYFLIGVATLISLLSLIEGAGDAREMITLCLLVAGYAVVRAEK